MAVRVVVHVLNEEAFVAEVDELPSTSATTVYLKNPKTREGRPVKWAGPNSAAFLFPWSRIAFIEVQMDSSETAVKFFPEDTRR